MIVFDCVTYITYLQSPTLNISTAIYSYLMNIFIHNGDINHPYEFIPTEEYTRHKYKFMSFCSKTIFEFCKEYIFYIYVGGSKSSETSRISPQIYNEITPNLYRVRNYHLLICQCCQNDVVRSHVHDVIV